MWIRQGRYLARLTANDPVTGKSEIHWIPLEGPATVAEAKKALDKLKVGRETGDLPALRQGPKFSEFADRYLAYCEHVKDAMRPKTLQNERGHLNLWQKHLGDTRLDKITLPMVRDFIAKRQGQGTNPRTVNLLAGEYLSATQTLRMSVTIFRIFVST